MKLAPLLILLIARAAAADDGARAEAWALPVGAGPDLDNVDAERVAARPGTGESPWNARIAAGTYAPTGETAPLVLAEIDRHVRFAGGRIGVAASAGFLQTCAEVMPHQTLRLFPLFAGLVYRTPALGWSFAPLIASAKLGPAYQIWRRDDAQGGKLGWRGSAGVALRLDRIDPDASRVLASDAGIDHTAVSLELTYFSVAGFPRALTWSLGLDFDF